MATAWRNEIVIFDGIRRFAESFFD